MKTCIFDVEHGFCAMLFDSSGKVMLIDAGVNRTTGFSPSRFLKSCNLTDIEYFIITNYDEDHASDCPRIIEHNTGFNVRLYRYNKSISVEDLSALKRKTGGIGPGLTSLLAFRKRARNADRGPSFDDFEVSIFRNRYPDMTNTNDLSLLTFVRSNRLTLCFPGDLERAGWVELLKKSAVRTWLGETNVFVASHHGRASGFVPEVFSHARPRIVVVSDGPIQYDTQDVDYKSHVTGLHIGGKTRYVLTTRRDGDVYFEDPGDDIPASIGATRWSENYFRF